VSWKQSSIAMRPGAGFMFKLQNAINLVLIHA
jgi:hypothetical protein